ncbi:MAG: hypothetical protein AB8I08_39665 [Sandaracinaceae bacterium]
MLTHSWLVISSLPVLLVSACGGRAQTVDPTPSTTGGEAAACPATEATEIASAPGTESFDGWWFVAEADSDEVELALELQGLSGMTRRTRGGSTPTAAVSVQPAGDGLHRLVLSSPERRDSLSILWSFTGPDRALVFRGDDDDLAVAWRAGPVPEAMQGQWLMEEPDSRDVIPLDVSRDRFVAHIEAETEEARAWALRTGQQITGFVIARQRRGQERMSVLRVSAVSPGVYLVWENGDDDYRVIYRPSSRPDWLIARPVRESSTAEASAPAP